MIASGRQLFTFAVATASIVSLQLVSSVTPFSRSFVNVSFLAPALAKTPQYVPPTSRGTPMQTQTGGVRVVGCLNSAPVFITLLVPNNHVGQSASERPTFAWYVSNPTAVNVPMQFTLTEPGVDPPLVVEFLKADKTGLVQLELTKDTPLQPGHQYRWTVSVTCNPQRPSSNVYALGWIERVTTTVNQAKAIAEASSDNKRALVYARSGLWYDALSAMSKAYQANPKDASTFESFVSLLDEVGLNQVAMQERKSFSKQYSDLTPTHSSASY